MNAAERARDRLGPRHRQRRARGREDRRLRRGRRGREDRDDQQLVEWRSEHALTQRSEHVALIVDQGVDSSVGLGGGGDEQVDPDQDERRDDRRAARRGARVLGLLVDGDPGVPAPVDEDRQQDAAVQRAEARDVERVEPRERGLDRVLRVVHVNRDQGDDGEDHQRHELHAEQVPLGARRELDPAIADPGHDDDPGDPDDRHPERRGCGPAEQLEGVVAGDRGEARHHEHVGDDDRPAALPAEPRAHRPGHPGERRAAVRVGAVHVVVGRRDARHREERDEDHGRRLQPQTADRGDEAQRGREAVARRGRGDADDDVGDERDRVLLQALVLDVTSPDRLR